MKLITDSNLELVIQAFYDRIVEEFKVAESADKLTTGRTLTIGNSAKTFDGTQDLFWSLTDIGIGSPSNLTTSNKSNVVNAINELNANKASIAYVDNAVENVSIDDAVTAVELVGNVEDIEIDYVTQSELEKALANLDDIDIEGMVTAVDVGDVDIEQGGGSSSGTVSSGIAVNSTYVSNANDTNSIIGYYPTNNNTLNLPAVCYNAGDEEYSLWGILFTQVEPIYRTLVQQYIPTWGAWQNVTFTRIYNKDDGFSPWNCHLDSSEWSDELQTNNKTLIGAINELFQNANNGKELIATAIGSPLSSSDTFSAMSTKINTLTTSFKSALLNKGVAISGTDTFQSLITKIESIDGGSSNTGTKVATGEVAVSAVNKTFTLTELNPETGEVTASETISLPCYAMTVDFEPSMINAEIVFNIEGNYSVTCTYSYDNISNPNAKVVMAGFGFTLVTPLLKEGNTIYLPDVLSIESGEGTSTPTYPMLRSSYAAIGIGEVGEDPALLESLKSILQEEGVTVTEEDNMASLISKVDEEFDRKNDSIVTLGDISVNSDVTSSTTIGSMTSVSNEVMYYNESYSAKASSTSTSTYKDIINYTVKFTGTVVVSVLTDASGNMALDIRLKVNDNVVSEGRKSFTKGTKRINYTINVGRGDTINFAYKEVSGYYSTVNMYCPAIFCKWD